MPYILSPYNPISSSFSPSISSINLVNPITVTSETYTTSITSPLSVSLSPLIPSINLSFTRPSLGFYEDLNQDPKVQRNLTKIYYYKVLDEWLWEDFPEIFGYLTYQNGKVDLINNLNQYDPTASEKDSEQILNKKVDFLGKFFLTKSIMVKILKKFITETNTNWIDLSKNEFFLKQIVQDKLTRLIKRAISDKNSMQKTANNK
ncbi:Hypothetical protein KVN_LOCUS263 [uncultured virus]|nr:Hypothetical protein KVN_LOCUS263 [uncultured virus]